MGYVGGAWYTSCPDDHYVCADHVDDDYLQRLLEDGAEDEPCWLCGAERGAPLEALLEAVEQGLLLHYETAANAGVPWEGGWAYPTMDTWDVINDLVYEGGLDDELASEVVELFDDEAWVHKGDPFLTPGKMLTAGWRRFVEHVKHRSRFLMAPSEGSFEEALHSG